MNLYKSTLPVMGNRNFVICNLSEDEDPDKIIKTVRDDSIPIHHIEIIDRSYSMVDELDELIENVKQTINSMKDSDFYTVIWFSDENEYSTILKGVPASSDKKASFKLLDTLKSPMSCTCFYQATEEALKISDELLSLCDNISITLFTDGKSTTDGDYGKVNKFLSEMSDNIISFNTIGYGNYCDEDRLIGWSLRSQYGKYTHSSKIDEYFEIFDQNYRDIEGLKRENISIKIPHNCRGFYITNRSIMSFYDDLNLNYMDKNKNQIIIVSDNNDLEDFEFSVNDETINTSSISKSISNRWVRGLLYKLAYCEYTGFNRRESLQILRDLGDKPLIDDHMRSFTFVETENHAKKLKKAAYQSKYRNTGTCDENYVPSENSPCIMDLLKIVCDCPDNKYYSDINYSRVGRKVTDEFNMFHKYENDDGLRDINDIVFNEKKLNVSVRFRVNGYVSINPKQAKEVGLEDSNIPCCIYRTHTIVKDGNLNIDTLCLRISQETFDRICNMDVDGLIKDEPKLIRDMYNIVLDLTTLPVTNVLYDNMKTEDIYNMVKRSTIIKGYLKAIKYYISNTHDTTDFRSSDRKQYTDEQIKLLDQYGIGRDGVYRGIANNTPKVKDSDFYISRTVEFTMKGFSKLNSVAKVLENGGAKGDTYLREGLEIFSDYSLDELIDERRDLSKELSEISCMLCACKIAKILTGSFFDNVEISNKDNVYTYTSSSGDVMNIKIDYEKVYF